MNKYLKCPSCGGELAYAGMEPNGGYTTQHYKCLLCQKEFIQEIIGNATSQLIELTEVREVEPELIPEESEDEI